MKPSHKRCDIYDVQDVFLEGCFPAASLIPLVLNAQIIVIPVEHVADARITELRIGED